MNAARKQAEVTDLFERTVPGFVAGPMRPGGPEDLLEHMRRGGVLMGRRQGAGSPWLYMLTTRGDRVRTMSMLSGSVQVLASAGTIAPTLNAAQDELTFSLTEVAP